MSITTKSTCEYCGQEYEVGEYGFMRQCPKCTQGKIEKKNQNAIDYVNKQIDELIPTRFHNTDTSHPDFNNSLWSRVSKWQPTDSEPWLGLIGQTGESKTRCAFLKMRMVAIGMIRKVQDHREAAWWPSAMVVSAYRFNDAAMAQFSDDRDAKAGAIDFMRKLRNADLLMIDDLGKQRNTPAVSSELFALVDHRHAQNSCTIWTSNGSPEDIVKGMSDDMAAPLAGRIMECSTIIRA